MMYEIANDRACVDCKHSGKWRGYPDSFRVCNQPTVLARLGGPRSCRDIVRAPGGLCSPEGKLFERQRRER